MFKTSSGVCFVFLLNLIDGFCFEISALSSSGLIFADFLLCDSKRAPPSFCWLFKCSLDCQHVKAISYGGGKFQSLEGKKASVNYDGAERKELKLMKSWETGLLASHPILFPLVSLWAGTVCQRVICLPETRRGIGGAWLTVTPKHQACLQNFSSNIGLCFCRGSVVLSQEPVRNTSSYKSPPQHEKHGCWT